MGLKPTISCGSQVSIKSIFAPAKFLGKIKLNNLHYAWKCAQIFVYRHCLFCKAHSFVWTLLSENCKSFLEQILSAHKYPSIFLLQIETIVYIIIIAWLWDFQVSFFTKETWYKGITPNIGAYPESLRAILISYAQEGESHIFIAGVFIRNFKIIPKRYQDNFCGHDLKCIFITERY